MEFSQRSANTIVPTPASHYINHQSSSSALANATTMMASPPPPSLSSSQQQQMGGAVIAGPTSPFTTSNSAGGGGGIGEGLGGAVAVSISANNTVANSRATTNGGDTVYSYASDGASSSSVYSSDDDYNSEEDRDWDDERRRIAGAEVTAGANCGDNGSGRRGGVSSTLDCCCSLTDLTRRLRRQYRVVDVALHWGADQWVVMVLLYIIPTIVGVLVPPFCKQFDLLDYSINLPFAEEEMFPSWTLVPIVLAPIVLVYVPIILFFTKYRKEGGSSSSSSRRRTAGREGTAITSSSSASSAQQSNSSGLVARLFRNKRRQWRDISRWTLAQLVATGLTLAIINTTKVMGGRLRPDFVSRLRKEGLVAAEAAPTSPPSGLPNYPPQWAPGFGYESVCEHAYLQSNHLLRDGHLSFPSGHSGCAFSAMVPLCVFLFLLLRPVGSHSPRRTRGGRSSSSSLFRLIIALLPIILSWVVALSRVQDYRHNYSDILAGSVIGAACALLTQLVLGPTVVGRAMVKGSGSGGSRRRRGGGGDGGSRQMVHV